MKHLLFSFHTCPMEEPGAGLSGGMNVFLRGLLPGLAVRGLPTDVLTRGKGTGIELTRPFPGVRIFHLPCGWRDPPTRESAYDALPRFARKARELLARERPAHDVVSAHYWMSGVASLEAGLRPHAFAYHTVQARKAASDDAAPMLSDIRKEAEERLSRESSHVVCFSENDLARTGDIFPAVAEKGIVIPPGLDDAFRNPPHRREARRRYGIPRGSFLFLLAARRDPGKNVASAVGAFRAFRSAEGDRPRLLVAGQELPRLVSSGVVSVGPVPHAEMPFLYSAADAVLCPSSYESFGLVPLEAMAAGKPVIAPAGGFWGETIVSEGGGIAYDPETQTSLAEAMRAVYREESLRARLSEQAVRIAARFTWETCTESWARLLSRIATPGSPQ